MINWYLKVVRDNYANFSGRARRSEYWYYTLCGFIIDVVLRGIDYLIGLNFNLLGTLYSLAVFIPGTAVMVRRFHDIGKSGWYVLWVTLATIIIAGWFYLLATTTFFGDFEYFMWMIPLILMIAGFIQMIVFLCTHSETGSNKYGKDPKNPFQEAIDEIGTEVY